MPDVELNGLALEGGVEPATVEVLHNAGGSLQINVLGRDGGMGNRIDLGVDGDKVVLRLWQPGHWSNHDPWQVLRVLDLEPREDGSGSGTPDPDYAFEVRLSLGVFESDSEGEADFNRAAAQAQWRRLREGLPRIPETMPFRRDEAGLEFMEWEGVLPEHEARLLGTRLASGRHINAVGQSRRSGEADWLLGLPRIGWPGRLYRVWLSMPVADDDAGMAAARQTLGELTRLQPGLSAPEWGEGPIGRPGVGVEFDTVRYYVHRIFGDIARGRLLDRVQMAIRHPGAGEDEFGPWQLVSPADYAAGYLPGEERPGAGCRKLG